MDEPGSNPIPSPAELSGDPVDSTVGSIDDLRQGDVDLEGWTGDAIEQAYQKALAVLGDLPWEARPSADEPVGAEPGTDSESDEPAAVSVENTEVEALEVKPIDSEAQPPAMPHLAPGTDRHPRLESTEHSNVTPMQVIEAALFVGGGPLTAKKICHLARGSFDARFVEQAIDELNERYVAEGRPFEIRLGEGGYRLELRPEYEKLRQRVYGAGPREVKLSQDVLEVLALVAYQQPITQPQVESHGKPNAASLLRQLIRRDLIAIHRGDGGRKDVRYHTTPRFLTVFGLGNIDELPQPDDLARK
ncbi:MAG: SMC-Scp complex subunit ScpB [Planctomycetaceae bacterium]|nr:SMC-Scp complex subunit ScpB [Planctomycetaceae bacterium]